MHIKSLHISIVIIIIILRAKIEVGFMLDMDTNFIIIIVIIITILLVWQVRTKCAYFLMLILYSLQHRMQLCWSRYTDCLS